MNGSSSPALALDSKTVEDLGLFEGHGGARSLFDFCDRTRTEGGRKALRARMRTPFAEAAQIRATQSALAAIGEAREAFSALPTEYLLKGTQRHLRNPRPPIGSDGGLLFFVRAIAFWIDDFRGFSNLTHGVEQTRRTVHRMRALADAPALARAPGELGALIDRVRTCCAHPAIAQTPDQSLGASPLRVLRLDQQLRGAARAVVGDLVDLAHELDALIALADTVREEALVFPVVDEGALAFEACALAHPLLDSPVANDAALDPARNLLFLTGPNMAGKTTYLRAVAISVYFAHIGLGVRAEAFRFSPATHLLTALSLEDDLQGGVSYFRAEALRVRDLADAIAQGGRVIAFLDEPFKGTNVKDALDASAAVLSALAECASCLCLVSSHLIELEDTLRASPNVDCRYFEAQEHGSRLSFDYRLRTGVSAQRLGMRVLAEEGVFERLDEARTREA